MVALGSKTSERWNQATRYPWHRSRRASGAAAEPLLRPVRRDDERVLRVVDPIASMEALQVLKKKQYEEERSKSNGAVIPRCPFKGAGHRQSGGRRSRISFNPVSPILFTIPNFLTAEQCEGFIAVAEAEGFRHQTREHHLGWAGGAAFAKDEFPPPWLPDSLEWKASKAWSSFTRTNAYCNRLWCNSVGSTLDKFLWTPRIKAVFDGIRVEGHEEALAVGVNKYSIAVHRYEKGEMCEPHNSDMLRKPHRLLGSDICTVDGYDVLVYLNESQADPNSHEGSPSVVDRPVSGGETVFYSQQYLNGNSMKKHIAKTAPETGMAVCIARGQRTLLHEIRPLTKGVTYMIEFSILFSGFKEVVVPDKKPQRHSHRGMQNYPRMKKYVYNKYDYAALEATRDVPVGILESSELQNLLMNE